MKPQYITIDDYGSKFYYCDEEMEIPHREDGPACEWHDGTNWWIQNGEYHREDGPAIEWLEGDGYKYWYLNGINYSEEEFNEKMNPVKTININGREFTIEKLNSLIETVKRS